MNREQLEQRAAGKIEKVLLADGAEVFVRPLSALDRARILDRYRQINTEHPDNEPIEDIVTTQCLIVARSLIDPETRNLLYPEEDLDAISNEIDWKSMDAIAKRVIDISGLGAKDDPEKNSQTTPKDDLSSD